MDSETKFRKFFRVWRDIFHLILGEIKAGITKIKKYNTTRQQTLTLEPCCQKIPACRAEGKVRMPPTHDAAEPCGVSLRDTHARDFQEPVRFDHREPHQVHASVITWLIKKNQDFNKHNKLNAR
jgi:hypothetical protein